MSDNTDMPVDDEPVVAKPPAPVLPPSPVDFPIPTPLATSPEANPTQKSVTNEDRLELLEGRQAVIEEQQVLFTAQLNSLRNSYEQLFGGLTEIHSRIDELAKRIRGYIPENQVNCKACGKLILKPRATACPNCGSKL